MKITIQHRFQAAYELGRFRIWLTTSSSNTGEGLPSDIADIEKISSLLRTPQQAARMMEFYRMQDAELRLREQALVVARSPLPSDAKAKELKAELARVSKPVSTDPALVQLRQDIEASARQITNKRLTAAQDLTWALINTPSFLFNR